MNMTILRGRLIGVVTVLLLSGASSALAVDSEGPSVNCVEEFPGCIQECETYLESQGLADDAFDEWKGRDERHNKLKERLDRFLSTDPPIIQGEARIRECNGLLDQDKQEVDKLKDTAATLLDIRRQSLEELYDCVHNL